jgi:hypothetical protein
LQARDNEVALKERMNKIEMEKLQDKVNTLESQNVTQRSFLTENDEKIKD